MSSNTNQYAPAVTVSRTEKNNDPSAVKTSIPTILKREPPSLTQRRLCHHTIIQRRRRRRLPPRPQLCTFVTTKNKNPAKSDKKIGIEKSGFPRIVSNTFVKRPRTKGHIFVVMTEIMSDIPTPPSLYFSVIITDDRAAHSCGRS